MIIYIRKVLIFNEFNFACDLLGTGYSRASTWFPRRIEHPPIPPNMKIKIPFVAAFFAAIPALSSAFTIDFNSSGTFLPNTPQVINVPGYGNVTFTAASNSTLPVGSTYLNDNGFGAPAVLFENGEGLQVTFNAAPPLNVDFDFVGVSAGEDFTLHPDLFTPQTYILTFAGQGDGAGLYQISWNSVPEPSSAFLGLVGVAGLVLRRRR